MDAFDTGQMFDRDDAFMAGLMGEPGRPGHVADGVNAGLAGFTPFVDLDMTPVDLDPGAFEAKILDIAGDADGEDDAIKARLLRLAVFRRDFRRDLALRDLQALDTGRRQKLHALGLEGLGRGGGYIGIFHRKDAVQHFDHRHLGAKVVIEARELDADGARPHHQELARNRLGDHGFPVGDNVLAVRFQPGQFARPGAGGDDDVLGREAVQGLAVGIGDGEFTNTPRPHAVELGAAVDDRDLVFLHQSRHAPGKPPGDGARPGNHLLEIDAIQGRLDAELPGAVDQMGDLGGAQQCLGRDTAPVKADAAHVLALDHHRFQAQLGGANGGDIAPRPAADDDQIK